MRRILVAGLSHHLAPVGVRERLAITPRDYPRVLTRLLAWPGVEEGAVLSTCNRSEVYAVASPDDDVALPAFARGLGDGEPSPDVDPYLFCLDGEAAVRHLFEVAAGIDSQVLGEPQILGQVREAFAAARASGTVGTTLDRLFQSALEAGKRVRTETDIGAYAVSVPFAAVELARKIFGSLESRPALIVGAGEMGELTVRHLLDAGVLPVSVAARSTERVEAMEKRLGAPLIPRELSAETLAEVDVVVAASSAPHTLVSVDMTRRAMALRRQRPLFFIDIAVPRNVEEVAGAVNNVFLYNIDDLAQVVEGNRDRRLREVERARVIVGEETARFIEWHRGRAAVPTLVALRERLERVREEEEARALARLGQLSERDRAQVARFGRSLVNRILHEPTVRLRSASGRPGYPGLADALAYLFALDSEPASDEDRSDQSDG